MKFARRFRGSTISVVVLSLVIVTSSVLGRQNSATTVGVDGSDVTQSEVNDRTHYKTGGEIVQPLRIAAVEVDPFFTRQLMPSGDSVSGYLVDVVKEMSRIVPFQIEWLVVEKEDGNGRKRKNGNGWAELTEKLSNEVANVSVLPINSVSLHHARRFSYTQPLLKSTISVLVRAPDTPSDHRPWLLENLLNDTEHSRLGFGVSSEAVAYQLKTSNLSLYQQIWNDKTPSEIVISLEEGLRKVRRGDFALIMESLEASYHSSREPCDLLALDQFTHETSYVLATRRNGSLVGRLDAALTRLSEGDFFGKLFRKWWDTDECTLRRDETDRDDIDLDMERIFFTSPIKFFKSKIDAPRDTHDSTRSGSLNTEQSTRTFSLDAYHEDSDRNPSVSETVSERPDGSADFGHGRMNTEYSAEMELHRKRDRTTHTDSALPPTSVAPSFEVRVQADPELHRKSTRRSRTRRPKQTSTPTSSSSFTQHRTQVPLTLKFPHLDFEVQSPVLRTSPTSSVQNVRWSDSSLNDGLENSQGSRHLGQKASYTAATPTHSKTTKFSRDFAKDLDWVFATELPRSDEDFNFEVDDYDDDDDDVYREQRVTVRAVEARQKDTIKGTSSKDTGVRSDVKTKPNSAEKLSSIKMEFATLTVLFTIRFLF